jgi:hypothetical protein
MASGNKLRLRLVLDVLDKALAPLGRIHQGSNDTAKALMAARLRNAGKQPKACTYQGEVLNFESLARLLKGANSVGRTKERATVLRTEAGQKSRAESRAESRADVKTG